jgi:hypothetical protein
MYHALFGCTVDWKSCLGVHDDINSKNMSARSEIKVPGRATRDSSTEFVGFLMSGQFYGNMKGNQDPKPDNMETLLHRFSHQDVGSILNGSLLSGDPFIFEGNHSENGNDNTRR